MKTNIPADLCSIGAHINNKITATLETSSDDSLSILVKGKKKVLLTEL